MKLVWSLCVLMIIVICVACSTPGPRQTATTTAETASPGLPAGKPHQATIRWTQFGVPHVEADNFGDLSFGQGYAFAKGHICILAEQIVKVRSERARYFGRGLNDANANSDFGFLALGLYEEARKTAATARGDSKAIIEGFVAGYNHYLARTPAQHIPEPCRGMPWLRALEPVDLIAYSRSIAMLASGAAFVSTIGAAKPHTAAAKGAWLDVPGMPRASAPASNGWAIGSERSANGTGMLVANPHFPWEGALQFYEVHLTIPGQLDAYGATLMGMPLISIGFNEHVAWTHTFSSSTRFALYRLKLDPKDPTQYRYGDATRTMTSVEYAIEAKNERGKLDRITRRLYRSHYGPMLDGGPLQWDTDSAVAFTLRDAASSGVNALDQYVAMMKATNLETFEAALRRYQSTPFVNTIYADDSGQAFFVDGSRVPDLTDEALTAWTMGRAMIPALRAAWTRGVAVLDGSKPLFDWRSEGPSGSIPYNRAPKLRRRDFVFNSNDSAWIANPAAPISGFSPLYGDIGQPLSMRTRMNLTLLSESGANTAMGDDGKFDAAELEAALLSNRGYMAELLRKFVVPRCYAGVRFRRSHPRARSLLPLRRSPPAPAMLELDKICELLSLWDGRLDLDSKGAVLWRELLGSLPADSIESGSLFAVAFDAAHPSTTPRGLAPAAKNTRDPVLVAIDAARDRLHKAGYDPLTVTLRDTQFAERGGERFALHGGDGIEGTLNKAKYGRPRETLLPGMNPGVSLNPRTGLTNRGYPVNYGTSFLMIVELGRNGPSARGIMTYGSSSDPASPHTTDQLSLWQKKKLRPLLFRRADIESDPALVIERVSNTN